MVAVATTVIRTVEIGVRDKTLPFPKPEGWDKEKKRNRINITIGRGDPEEIAAQKSQITEWMNPETDQVVIMCIEDGVPVEHATWAEAEKWLTDVSYQLQ